ncbi:hypothetical protein [Faecalispora anaeroviscerum]|uniref:hypothetical protein n=1 Tax=Faecalispora anaeroviscerum TaxID=2991836 RepID=UPI0024B891C4|nr:hypothetical protein [Faecalispora anaeroviscerum]
MLFYISLACFAFYAIWNKFFDKDQENPSFISIIAPLSLLGGMIGVLISGLSTIVLMTSNEPKDWLDSKSSVISTEQVYSVEGSGTGYGYWMLREGENEEYHGFYISPSEITVIRKKNITPHLETIKYTGIVKSPILTPYQKNMESLKYRLYYPVEKDIP